jgi:hypothetical protein
MKISVQIEMPKQLEHKETIQDRVKHAMECIEYGTDPAAYQFLRRVNNCLVKCYEAGKTSPKMLELLKELQPFMAKHGLHDPRGVEFTTIPTDEVTEDET